LANRLTLRNAVVLLTGAGNGIGRQILEELQSRGAQVVALDIDLASLNDLQPLLMDKGAILPADVSDAGAMREAVAHLLQQFGRIDVVIANAGIERIGAVREMDAETFERVIEVNLLGVYRTIKPTLRAIETSRGHILAIASVAGLLPLPLAASYCTSKAGVDMLMRCLRFELMGSGATCGTAYLGFVESAMAQRAFSSRQVNSLLDRAPTWLLGIKPVQDPRHVARVLVDGIEGRRARVFVPFLVRVTFLLRGIYPLLDDFFARRIL
jgi:NAD(P)-dependent dehydrogenase (short-subunit alcohol dehydrogenase family)